MDLDRWLDEQDPYADLTELPGPHELLCDCWKCDGNRRLARIKSYRERYSTKREEPPRPRRRRRELDCQEMTSARFRLLEVE